MSRHDGRNSRVGSITKVYGGVVVTSTSLNYPVTMTTGPGTADGFNVSAAPSPPGYQEAISVKNSSGVEIWGVGNYGGPRTFGWQTKVYNPAGTAWAGFDGTLSPPPLQMVNGSSAQGIKISSGSGAPSSTTLPNGAGAVGDKYYCRSGSQLIAAAHSTAGTGAVVSAGSGTPVATGILNGAPAVGDLVVVVSCNQNGTETMTIGATAGITATATDGGYTVGPTASSYIRVYSHVIQSGDITSNIVKATSTTNGLGTGRRMMMWIFRNVNGWATTGSRFGCAMYTTPATYGGTSASNLALSLTGPTSPTVAVFAEYANAAISPTVNFDSHDANVASTLQVPELPTSAQFPSYVCGQSKPGTGLNWSAPVGYKTGGPSVSVTGQTTTSHMAVLATWKPNGTVDPVLYVCTAAGSPGTWVKVV